MVMRRNHGSGRLAALAAAVMGLVAAVSLAAGCSRKADLTQPFAMAMGGEPYESRLREPVGYLDEIEAGFNTFSRCTLVFPLKVAGPMNRPGVQIGIDPTKITIGETLTFEAGGEPQGVTIDYSPASGHNFSKAVMLAFSSGRSRGSCSIRFDELDCQLGGRVRGTLVRATLYGYKEDAHSGQVTELGESRKLELANFPFDLTLGRVDQAMVRQASGIPAGE